MFLHPEHGLLFVSSPGYTPVISCFHLGTCQLVLASGLLKGHPDSPSSAQLLFFVDRGKVIGGLPDVVTIMEGKVRVDNWGQRWNECGDAGWDTGA